MIFEPIASVKSKDDFLEKIHLYVRIVESIAEKNNAQLPSVLTTTPSVEKMMLEMGVVSSVNDIPLLVSCLKQEYIRFISCISFAIANKKMIGTQLDKLNNKKRAELQAKEKKSSKPTFVEFFAGAGGSSCGFTHAGYRVCFANDYEDVCVRTYRYNHPELSASKVVKGDIREIVKDVDKYIDEAVDVVVGGPPCQGFSSANQQRIIDDPRNELYKYYIQAVKKIKPKFVVMENVRGMLSVADQVVEDYQNIDVVVDGKHCSYVVAYRLLNSSDFSVAQSRDRLIYIAIRTDIAKKKKVTPEIIFGDIQDRNKERSRFVLNDALQFIKKLEAPREKNTNEIDSETCGRKVDVNQFSGADNEYLRLINGGRSLPLVFNHKARYVSDVNYDIYRLLGQGEDASDPKIADIMPYKHRLHCFKDKYYKLIANRPSRTITAHLRMDCHSHIHPFQIRAITPREAARCQSFPDDYVFLGAYLKTYMQIGNAVPCLMAQGIAECIKRYL